jgi:hypothetical protein
VVIFMLASKLRPGDEVYLGAASSPTCVLAVTPVGPKLRIATQDGWHDVEPGQRVRVS